MSISVFSVHPLAGVGAHDSEQRVDEMLAMFSNKILVHTGDCLWWFPPDTPPLIGAGRFMMEVMEPTRLGFPLLERPRLRV